MIHQPFLRAALFALALSCGASLFAAPLTLKNAQELKQVLLERRSSLISQSTHKKLLRIHALIQKEKYPQALELVEQLRTSTKNRPFELAQSHHLEGIIYAQMEKYVEAAQSFQKALKLEVLPYTPTLSLMFATAQVQMAGKQITAAIETLEAWESLAEEIRPDARAFLAAVYAEDRQLKKAQDQIERALQETPQTKETWLKLSMALHSELGEPKKALLRAQQLTAMKPDDLRNWKQMSGLYLANEKSPEALASLELGHKTQNLKEKGEIFNLVGLRLQEGLPLDAAQLLEAGINSGQIEKIEKNWEILSSAWLQAEETAKSIGALREAAKLGRNGKNFARLGQLYMETEDWTAALESFRLAIKKGQLKNPEQIHLGVGLVLYQMGQPQLAIDSLRKSQSLLSKGQSQNLASWIEQLETEMNLKKNSASFASRR